MTINNQPLNIKIYKHNHVIIHSFLITELHRNGGDKVNRNTRSSGLNNKTAYSVTEIIRLILWLKYEQLWFRSYCSLRTEYRNEWEESSLRFSKNLNTVLGCPWKCNRSGKCVNYIGGLRHLIFSVVFLLFHSLLLHKSCGPLNRRCAVL